MPTYEAFCKPCGVLTTFVVPVAERDMQKCRYCGAQMERRLAAPLFRFAGVATKGGGPDKFTADMLGIPLKELPDGLKTEVK